MFLSPKANIITSESVAAGHPDKIADQISDAIVDEYILADPFSRTAIETLVTKDNIVIAGEVFAPDIGKSRIEEVVRYTIKNIGYENGDFNWQDVKVQILLHEQSQDIAIGVSKNKGAGDQGIMYGYATSETEDLMPAPIYYAHSILKNIISAVGKGEIWGFGPDAKSQVTLCYQNDVPICAKNIVVSIQHREDLDQKLIKEIIYPYVISTLPQGWMCPDECFFVNPTGRFVIGGPISDCGLTGRKIMVDSYGGHIPHGGGAFSGKDSTKVDRSAAYMARYLAKNIVKSNLAQRCLVQLSYAIGVVQPLSFYIDTFGTSTIDEFKITEFIAKNVDLSPGGICNHLQLNRPIYKPTACYGHFGRKCESHYFPWEKTDLSQLLRREFIDILVGDTGLEPATFCTSSKHSNQLS